ncbi:putative ribonuclease H-like domain-containing protein [Tanacetum coccineum]
MGLQKQKDERGIVIKNRARLVAQGYTQEEGIDYDELFAPVVRIKAIRLFLAYASFKDFVVYQMDVKSAFLYGKIEEEVYVCQPPGFEDPDFPDRVYKVEKALYGLHQAPRAWYETLSTYLLDNGFQRGKIDKTLFIKRHKSESISSSELTFFLGLQVKQKHDGIFISQEKYVIEILKKFGFGDIKIASTPMETHKPLLKDIDGEDVDEHLYRSMIRSLMYLTSSRPDIMFVVCACARFQVNPKVSHLHAVKRIFRYLKGQPKLGLWYHKDSSFDLVAYTNNDYTGASLDRKSTTGGCQFLGCRLISWQCKKQTVVANSTTKAKYIAASNCCAYVLWIQNQLLDYEYNFIQTKIIDNENSNKKKLIQMIKIHTDQNVADLLTKAFDINPKRLKDLGKPKRAIEISQSSGPIPLVADETVTKEWEDRMERATTTASSLQAEQDSEAQIRFEAAFKQSNDLPLSRVNTLGSGEDSMKLKELMELCTKLSKRATAKAKTVNGERQIQALVDKKKVIITETSVRSDLKIEDAKGTECLPNDAIFKQLTLMGYENLTQKLTFYKAYFSPKWKFLIHTILQCLSAKTTTWNEFSSTMASAIICLATNKKFNFSKYIFDCMVNNLEGGVKFLMYPRFVQVFINQQLGDMSIHNGMYVTSCDTNKIFPNMKREGKGFSGRITPLFQTMMVPAFKELGEGSEIPIVPQHKPTTTQPSTSQPQNKQKSRRKQKKGTKIPSSSGEPITDEAANVASIPSHSKNTNTSQAAEIATLKERVKKLEKKRRSRTYKPKRLYKGMNDDNLMFDTCVLDEQEVKVEKVVSTAKVTTTSTTTTIVEELTLAQTLIEIKAAKPKAVTTTATTITPASTRPKDKDKGKAKMVEEEPLKKFSMKEQIKLDQELAFKLQAKEEEAQRIEREKDEENVALIEEWDNVQAMIDANYQMAKQLQQQEQEQLSIEEKSKLFVQLLEARKKHFVEMKAREKRNKPPIQAQQRKLYCNYLKNMEGYDLKQLKGFKFEVIKDMFDKAFKRVNTFVEYKTELMEESSKKVEAEKESSSKRAGTELEQEAAKTQKIVDDQEEAKMKKHMEIVLYEEEIAVDAIPLAIKPPMIVEYKIVKEGKMGYF